jgi:hypothetical protein
MKSVRPAMERSQSVIFLFYFSQYQKCSPVSIKWNTKQDWENNENTGAFKPKCFTVFGGFHIVFQAEPEAQPDAENKFYIESCTY